MDKINECMQAVCRAFSNHRRLIRNLDLSVGGELAGIATERWLLEA
jgi:hypothetical protein